MRFRRQTDYADDIRLFRHGGGAVFWAALAVFALAAARVSALFGEAMTPGLWLALLVVAGGLYAWVQRGPRGAALGYGLILMAAIAAPHILGPYLISQLSFVFCYAIAGVGLWILLGLGGQISLGHAAFMACGAYTAGVLGAEPYGYGLEVVLPAAALLSATLGVVIGLPALRLTGIYLAFATYAFAFIVEEILARWESVTGGNAGLALDSPRLFGYAFDDDTKVYYLGLGLVVAAILAGLNIRRSSTGRAFMAIRDSETAAMSMGVNLATFKTAAFALSAAFAGIAGAFYAHLLFFISPEGFTIFLSIQLLAMVVIGGLGAIHGALLGAIFIIVLPQIVAMLRDTVTAYQGAGADVATRIVEAPGLESGLFGLVIVLMVIFEPQGLYGIWFRIKTFFELFPLFRKGTFKRQKSYMASERNK